MRWMDISLLLRAFTGCNLPSLSQPALSWCCLFGSSTLISMVRVLSRLLWCQWAPTMAQPAAKTTEQPRDKTTNPPNQPTSKASNRPKKQPTIQPPNKQPNQQTHQTSNQPANQATNPPTKQPCNQPANRPTMTRLDKVLSWMPLPADMKWFVGK